MVNLELNNGYFNIYDKILIFFVSTLIFGGYGDALQPIRVFSLLLFFFFNIKFLVELTRKRESVNLFFYFLLFTVYSICSLFWTIDVVEGIKSFFYIICHITIFVNIVILFKKARQPLRSLLYGWFLFILFTIPIAFIELVFDKHLNISFFAHDKVGYAADGTMFIKRFSSVTFGNYNTYVMNLIYALPFIVGLIFLDKLRFKKMLYLVLISVVVILLINSSRGGIICGGIIFCTLFLVKIKKGGSKLKMLVLIIFVFSVLVFLLPNILEQLFFRLQGRGVFEDKSRLQLIKNAIDICYDYNFLGSGIGSIDSLMAEKHSSINVPHNLVLELLVQFGILFTLPFLFFVISLFYYARANKSLSCRFILLSSFLSMPFLFVINSGYLYHPSLWVYLASLFVIRRFGFENIKKY